VKSDVFAIDVGWVWFFLAKKVFFGFVVDE